MSPKDLIRRLFLDKHLNACLPEQFMWCFHLESNPNSRGSVAASRSFARIILPLPYTQIPSSHHYTTAVLLLSLLIKHLTLSTQPITLRHEAVDLLPPLQHTFDGLVQHNLRLVQLPLYLHNRIRLVGILVFRNVLLQLWVWSRGDAGGGVTRPGILRGEFVNDL